MGVVAITAAPRALQDWDTLPADAHAAYTRLFEKMKTGQAVATEKREGALAKEFGVKDLFSVRANVKYRALLSRVEGGGWRIEALASRGDKRYYRHE